MYEFFDGGDDNDYQLSTELDNSYPYSVANPRSLAEAMCKANDHKFRQLPCRTFISVGCCPYRDRCVYLHDSRVALRDAKSKTRKKNKEDIIQDSLFWPVMPEDSVRSKLDNRNQPVVNQEYQVPTPCYDQYHRHDAAVYSMWQHFIAFCILSNAETDNYFIPTLAYKVALATVMANSFNTLTGERRLPVFEFLSNGTSIPHNAVINDRIEDLIKELTATDSNDHIDALIKDLTVSDANGPSNFNAPARSITDPTSRTITKPIAGLASISAFSIAESIAATRPITSNTVRSITPKAASVGTFTNSHTTTNATAYTNTIARNDHLNGTRMMGLLSPVQSPTSITARLSPIGPPPGLGKESPSLSRLVPLKSLSSLSSSLSPSANDMFTSLYDLETKTTTSTYAAYDFDTSTRVDCYSPRTITDEYATIDDIEITEILKPLLAKKGSNINNDVWSNNNGIWSSKLDSSSIQSSFSRTDNMSLF